MSRARYQSSTPCPSLGGVVQRYWQLETEPTAGLAGRWALPDGGSDWVFVLGDPLVRSSRVLPTGAYAAGVPLAAYLSKPAGRMLTVGIVFKPAGAAAVTRLPACELTNRVVQLESLWDSPIHYLTARLSEAAGFAERIKILETELLMHLRPSDPEVMEAIQ